MIYFIQVDNYLKVGYTSNLKERYKAYITENPNPPKLLYTINGAYDIENKIHKQLKEFHHRAEWFHLTKECEALIKKIVKENKDNIEPKYVKKKRIKRLHLKVLEILKSHCTSTRELLITSDMKKKIAEDHNVLPATISNHIKKLVILGRIEKLEVGYLIKP